MFTRRGLIRVVRLIVAFGLVAHHHRGRRRPDRPRSIGRDGDLVNIGTYEGLLGTGFAGTAISPRLMLTATHISGNTTGYFTLDGTKYNMQLEATLDDLAMWEIAPNDSASFPSYVPVYSGTNETNLPLVDVGYGVQRGAAIPGGWLWGAGNGQLSWGTNTVAAIVQDGDIGESANFGGDFLQYNFNNNPTDPNEGILAFGDSGGGLFVLNNGVYQLAGVNSVVDTVLNSSGVQLQAALYNQNGYFTQSYPGGPLIPITTNTPDSAYATRIASKSNLLGVVQGTITPANAAAFPINNDGDLSVYTSMTTGASPAIPPSLSEPLSLPPLRPPCKSHPTAASVKFPPSPSPPITPSTSPIRASSSTT